MTAPSLSCARRVGSGRSTLTFALWKNSAPRSSHLVQVSPGTLPSWGIPLGKADVKSEGGDQPKSKVELMLASINNFADFWTPAARTRARISSSLRSTLGCSGGQYQSVQRHLGLDDGNIPDFTATRSWDQCQEILELKHIPHEMFQIEWGTFVGFFNDAWNQAARYIAFTRRRVTIAGREEVTVRDARCILIAGHEITANLLSKIAEGEHRLKHHRQDVRSAPDAAGMCCI